MDGVSYPQPLAGPEPQYVPWGVLLVRLIGHPPRPVPPRAADQRSRCIPPYCVCSGGADTVTGGAPKPQRFGPSPASPVGPFCPGPLFAVWFAVVGFPSLLGGVVVVGGVLRFSWPCCMCACPHLPWLWFAVGVCVRGAVRARVVSVLVCVSCVRGGVGVGVPSVRVVVCVCVCGCVVAAGWGLLLVWVWVWSVCAVAGPSLAGVRWRRWCVVCGVWLVVCGVRWWCVRGVVVWLVPRYSWLRVPGAVSRGSWLGFADAGGGHSSPLLAEGPGSGSPSLLAGVRWRRWCEVCGVWCVVCGVRRWSVGGVVAGVWRGWSLATPGRGSCVLLPATPGWISVPVVVGGSRLSWRRVPGAVTRHSWLGFAVGGGVWCVVCGVWCVVCGGGVLVGLWLVFGVVGSSPLLAEVPVC